ncbi:RNA polymerase sigma factor [Rubrimonas cliftonensis]|uniref:RNA polymerase sigma-70 factor, ECF subfamily n=1 Tax=Rubrimonas cliftonensis TaxID=89524 RepID=A0A1H4E7K2_9RHOB|nr:sigma-70 family RNA polymerase sigma factor [Rubrimonas cliftonensis]SEA80302.1 RNA polymerase sigma-70 factor, ECF subfamily [Rubrimonas cliftonensis]
MSQNPADARDAAIPAAEDSDDALMLRVAARDRAAFAALFGRYAGRVKGFMQRAGFPPHEADEAAQEVMLTVWRRAETFDPTRAGAGTWLFTVARNRRIDLMRRRRPEPDPLDPHFQPDPAPPADVAAAVADRDAAVRAALATLPPEQLEVVRLAYYEGLSQSEAAAALGAPLGTVKSRLRLAVARLREALGADFAEELFDD